MADRPSHGHINPGPPAAVQARRRFCHDVLHRVEPLGSFLETVERLNVTQGAPAPQSTDRRLEGLKESVMQL